MALAAGHGVRGVRVTGADELHTVLAQALQSPTPVLVEVKVEVKVKVKVEVDLA